MLQRFNDFCSFNFYYFSHVKTGDFGGLRVNKCNTIDDP
jgi:hypothetical protein